MAYLLNLLSISGNFCDDLLNSWVNNPQESPSQDDQDCSDCLLGLSQLQLSSPFGYDPDFADSFNSQTSSCGKTGYAFATPTSYELASQSATSTRSNPTATCISYYTIQDGDDCNSVAQANSVSTFFLLRNNNFLQDCSDFPNSGTVLCMPSKCTTYTARPNDTCSSIVAGLNDISSSQFLSWNPNLNSMCGNLQFLTCNQLCISQPGGSLNATATLPLAISTPTTPVPKQTNAEDGTVARCGRFYTIQEGDTCESISIGESISSDDFAFLNTEINVDCSNLVSDKAYCVQAVGDIATYSGYSTSNYITLTSATYSTATTTSLSPYMVQPITTADFPRASGTDTDCLYYTNYRSTDWLASKDNDTIALINSCQFVANGYAVTQDQLLLWNPSLTNGSCALQPGFSYCAAKNATSLQDTNQPISSRCFSVLNPLPGTSASCTCFTVIIGYDSGAYGCDQMTEDAKITVSQLTAWNTWIGSDCDLGLYANMADNDQRGVCIAAK
ncbi:Hypothetical protein R9X50_00380500 [Acrodontium crateriforme]|uniref:LysM domain-containing protein n=1 Tax=Acrodontium crateriforme TaxID=150365 RepID=A0AAQ3M6V4_9PEZI|nr:Hypothetical protein R9X50_00380500 [Acrodontium crateriforme]